MKYDRAIRDEIVAAAERLGAEGRGVPGDALEQASAHGSSWSGRAHLSSQTYGIAMSLAGH